MRKATAWIMLVALFPIILGGCATHTQTGALAGGATGGAIGGGIGGAIGGKGGALIGVALGTILGTAIGGAVGKHFDDRQLYPRTQASQAHDYRSSQGPLLVVSGLQVLPTRVKPGEPVQVTVTYDVLAPEPTRQIPITETWVFKHNTTQLKSIARPEERKDQGGYASTYTLAMAKTAPVGDYQAVVTVSNGVMATTVTTPFRVQH